LLGHDGGAEFFVIGIMRRVDQLDIDIRTGFLEAPGGIAIGLHPAGIALMHHVDDGLRLGEAGSRQQRGGSEKRRK